MLGAATGKAHLPRFSSVGTESDVGYLNCIGMVDRCRRLAKKGG